MEAARASAEFWALFGVAASHDSNAAPSPNVRAKLLDAVQKTRTPAHTPISLRRNRLVYAGAIAASILVMAAIGLRFGPRREPRPQLAVDVEAPQLDGVKQQVADLQRKLRDAEKEIEALTQVRPASAIVPVRLTQSPTADSTLELERALNEANQQIQQLRAALSGEQAKSARLAQEFDQQTVSIAALSRERRDAEANLAAASGRLAERDRQIKAMDAKIAQLERERDKLNDAVTNQKNRMEHATRLVALLSAPTVKLVRLAGTEAAPGASGYALLAEGKKLIFTGAGLPGLQPGRAYQLWLMRGKSPGIVSAGVFGGDRMSIELTDASLLQDIRGLAVTEEPKSGSPLPTGHKLLIGTSRS